MGLGAAAPQGSCVTLEFASPLGPGLQGPAGTWVPSPSQRGAPRPRPGPTPGGPLTPGSPPREPSRPSPAPPTGPCPRSAHAPRGPVHLSAACEVRRGGLQPGAAGTFTARSTWLFSRGHGPLAP